MSTPRKARKRSRDQKRSSTKVKRSRGASRAARNPARETNLDIEYLFTRNEHLLEMNRTLEEMAQRFADLYEFAAVAHLTLDDQGCIMEMNLSAAELLGVDRGCAIRKPLVRFARLQDRRKVLEHIRRSRTEERIVTELVLVSGDGREFPAEIASRREPSGRLRVIILDVTERHKAEAARKQADEERRQAILREQAARASAEAKDRFIAMISHELRTPLTPILATVSALELAPDGWDLRAALSRIRRNVELEARLIDDLLDVSRIENKKLRMELTLVRLSDVVHEVVDAFREQIERKGIDLRVAVGAEREWIQADGTRLHQAISNLVRNALQFTSANGRISIRLDNPEPSKVRLSVEDDGVGIQPEDLQRIFKPFEQDVAAGGKPRGLGLGLSICRGIIEAHGGTLTAFSRGLSHGARFSFELAALTDEEILELKATLRADAVKTSPGVTTVSPGAPRGTLRVLIVEDHLDSAEALSEILERHGYRTIVTTSMQAALEQAKAGFEVVISDIGLPDGTGLELIEKLRAKGPVTGIAISGFGSDKDVAASHRAGFAEHLTKPVSVRALLGAIERARKTSGGAAS